MRVAERDDDAPAVEPSTGEGYTAIPVRDIPGAQRLLGGAGSHDHRPSPGSSHSRNWMALLAGAPTDLTAGLVVEEERPAPPRIISPDTILTGDVLEEMIEYGRAVAARYGQDAYPVHMAAVDALQRQIFPTTTRDYVPLDRKTPDGKVIFSQERSEVDDRYPAYYFKARDIARITPVPPGQAQIWGLPIPVGINIGTAETPDLVYCLNVAIANHKEVQVVQRKVERSPRRDYSDGLGGGGDPIVFFCNKRSLRSAAEATRGILLQPGLTNHGVPAMLAKHHRRLEAFDEKAAREGINFNQHLLLAWMTEYNRQKLMQQRMPQVGLYADRSKDTGNFLFGPPPTMELTGVTMDPYSYKIQIGVPLEQMGIALAETHQESGISAGRFVWQNATGATEAFRLGEGDLGFVGWNQNTGKAEMLGLFPTDPGLCGFLETQFVEEGANEARSDLMWTMKQMAAPESATAAGNSQFKLPVNIIGAVGKLPAFHGRDYIEHD